VTIQLKQLEVTTSVTVTLPVCVPHIQIYDTEQIVCSISPTWPRVHHKGDGETQANIEAQEYFISFFQSTTLDWHTFFPKTWSHAVDDCPSALAVC
jgi:hypothetical protein